MVLRGVCCGRHRGRIVWWEPCVDQPTHGTRVQLQHWTRQVSCRQLLPQTCQRRTLLSARSVRLTLTDLHSYYNMSQFTINKWCFLSLLIRYDTMRYDTAYLMCSKKLTDSQLSLPHRINKTLKWETKIKLMSMISSVQSQNHEGSPMSKEEKLRWMTCHWIRPNVRHIGILHLVSVSTHHRSRHVILYQSAKFYPNRTTL